MKKGSLTIRLDGDLERMLARASRRLGRSRSEIAREALRRQLRLLRIEALRARIAPFAEAKGYLTDEDVFDRVS
jgi:predicted transcriptional regulator